MKFKTISEEFKSAVTLDELKDLPEDAEIMYFRGRYFVKTRDGDKEVPEVYTELLDDMYRDFKKKEKDPEYDKDKADEDRKNRIKVSFDAEKIANKAEAEIRKAQAENKKRTAETQFDDSSVEAEDLGSLGNIGELAIKIANALTNMMIAREVEFNKKSHEENHHPYDIAVADASNGEIMLAQDNPTTVKAKKLKKDETVYVRIYMDKSGSFDGDKSDFSNEIYKTFLNISRHGLVDTKSKKRYLKPGQLVPELYVFHDYQIPYRIPTVDSKGNSLPDYLILQGLQNVDGGSDGHVKMMKQIRSYAQTGVTDELHNIMMITDNSGVTELGNETPLEVNGIVWALFVDEPYGGHDRYSKASESYLAEEDVQDKLYGKYGTYIYQFYTGN